MPAVCTVYVWSNSQYQTNELMNMHWYPMYY